MPTAAQTSTPFSVRGAAGSLQCRLLPALVVAPRRLSRTSGSLATPPPLSPPLLANDSSTGPSRHLIVGTDDLCFSNDSRTGPSRHLIVRTEALCFSNDSGNMADDYIGVFVSTVLLFQSSAIVSLDQLHI